MQSVIKSYAYRLLCVLVLAGLVFSFVQPGSVQATASQAPAAQADPLAKIETQVLEELQASGITDFFIWMNEKADLSPAESLKTKLEKGRFVYETLLATADRTQKDMRSFLESQGVNYKPFYIANKILVQAGSYDLALAVASRPDVAQITANHQFQLQEPIKGPEGPQVPATIEPNLTFINADDVWALGINGAGTVLAGNDTGLDETHPTIAPHYRGCLNPPTCTLWDHNYNWWDATGGSPNNPYDGYGHGTHTTGTMVGDDGGSNQIGVAPGAQTIHCRNMDSGGYGSDATFTECFEWDLAPWDLSGNNPEPSMAPDAINNSWGYWGGDNPIFEDEIAALQAAGILVEVSAGNEGPGCSTLRSPGDYLNVLTTGSVDHIGQVFPGVITVSYWSTSRGPSYLYPDDYFPDIMAPGNTIRSALPGNSYDYWSGTSMAGPHATALVGLMWSACPSLRGNVALTTDIIRETAGPLTGQNGSNCGGNYTTGPNNDWGFGTIDALAAVNMALVNCAGMGSFEGTVYDAEDASTLAGVDVLAEWEGGLSWETISEPSGYYTLTVPNGTYTLTASVFGYYTATITDTEIVTDMVTSLDIYMEPFPTHVISGTVIDAYTDAPLLASVEVMDTPLAAAWTDPVTGFYSITVPVGDYTLQVKATAHRGEQRGVTVDQDQTQDFQLVPLPCTLLVDDDRNTPNVRAYYTNALNALNADYDVWDTMVDGEPTFDDLSGYVNVIWFNGNAYPNTFSAENEAAVGAYLDAGGNFLFSSQNYLSINGITSFGQDYLHIASYGSNVNYTTVTGANVFDGLGPYILTYPFTNRSDSVTPDAQAQVAFTSASGNAGVSYDGTSFNTIFTGYPLETIALEGRTEVLERALEFLGPCPCNPVSILSLDSDSPGLWGEAMNFSANVWGTRPFTYTWDFGGAGVQGGTDANPTYQYDWIGNFTVTLEVANACPSSDLASLQVTVLEAPPTPAWDKEIWINGEGPWTPDDSPFSLGQGDEVTIVDHVAVTHTSDVSFELAENWGEALALTGWETEVGDIITGTQAMTWVVSEQPAFTWYALTKTFEVQGGNWMVDSLLEALSVDGAEPQPNPIELALVHDVPSIDVKPMALEAMLDMDNTVMQNLAIQNLGGEPLNWSLAESPDAGWLSEDPDSATAMPGEMSNVEVTFDRTDLAIGVYTTTLEITSNDPDMPFVAVPVTLTVGPAADLELTISDVRDPVLVGELITYTLQVVNHGPQEAVSVTLTDTLPVSATFVSASGAVCEQIGGMVACELGNISSGTEVVLTIVVNAPETAMELVNQAMVSANTFDPDLANNEASETTQVVESFYVFLPLTRK